jgi:hypothetical protein
MEYPIAEPAEIAKLHVGDRIQAVLFVRGNQYWLGEIEVIVSPSKDPK